jgi:hypothetical protein
VELEDVSGGLELVMPTPEGPQIAIFRQFNHNTACLVVRYVLSPSQAAVVLRMSVGLVRSVGMEKGEPVAVVVIGWATAAAKKKRMRRRWRSGFLGDGIVEGFAVAHYVRLFL